MYTVEIAISKVVEERFRRLVNEGIAQGAVLPEKRITELERLRKDALLRGLRDLENAHAAHALY